MEHKSILESSIWQVFKIFVNSPTKIHYIKEISRQINLAPTSIKQHLLKLESKNVITKKQGERFKGFISNRNSQDFLFYKEIYNLINLRESGVIDYLSKLLYPEAIILYGSYSKGEDIETSDIDIFILSRTDKKIELERYEKVLKRNIHILIEPTLKNLNKNLSQEINNGIIIYGYKKDG